jgi:hypothetical protein
LVYSPAGKLLKSIATEGQGGVGGNAGGIAQDHRRLAVVNFGSGTVSVFVKDLDQANLRLESVIPAVASPVSVAFGGDHLYILSTTHVESHSIDRNETTGVAASPDGVTGLLHADGSAAQVGKLPGQLIITEKSNVIESVNLNESGAVHGSARLVANIPANVNAPFGLTTRGNDAYVTIAHANEVSLVRHDEVVTVTGSGTQSAPCWLALDGPYLYSSNSPSETVSRYLVYGDVITQQVAVAHRHRLQIGVGSGRRREFDAGRLAPVDIPCRRTRQSLTLWRRHDQRRCHERRGDCEAERRFPVLTGPAFILGGSWRGD